MSLASPYEELSFPFLRFKRTLKAPFKTSGIPLRVLFTFSNNLISTLNFSFWEQINQSFYNINFRTIIIITSKITTFALYFPKTQKKNNSTRKANIYEIKKYSQTSVQGINSSKIFWGKKLNHKKNEKQFVRKTLKAIFFTSRRN